MKLYHGSKVKFEQLERKQAQQGDSEVPEDELLNAIYLTPDYGRAVAMGSFPQGNNSIDEQANTITFGNPHLFAPDQDIYIYIVDSEKIPSENLKLGENGFDYVINEDKITPSEINKIKAREVLKFFKITNWKENKEINRSLKMK